MGQTIKLLKHSKGIWRVAEGFSEVTTSRPGILEGSKRICIVSDFGKTAEERIANAKLIAAAPALLKYAIDVMEILERGGGSIVPHLLDTDDNAGQKLREAIQSAI